MEEEPTIASLADLVSRDSPELWTTAGKIPWDDPAFSRRMLREHLSQDHDRASRRTEIVDRHVQWIHHALLAGKQGRILDLACGPGLYTSRLARLGHACVGVDFSPASIEYARSEAEAEGLSCEYRCQDLREAALGSGFDAALMIFGEFNTFSRPDAARILEHILRSLAPEGIVVLEVHHEAGVRAMGSGPATWFTAPMGLFSATPHLCLRESSWSEEHHVALERYHVVDAATAEVAQYTSTTQAYSDSEYASLLVVAGFDGLERCRSLGGPGATPDDDLFVVVGHAPGATG